MNVVHVTVPTGYSILSVCLSVFVFYVCACPACPLVDIMTYVIFHVLPRPDSSSSSSIRSRASRVLGSKKRPRADVRDLFRDESSELICCYYLNCGYFPPLICFSKCSATLALGGGGGGGLGVEGGGGRELEVEGECALSQANQEEVLFIAKGRLKAENCPRPMYIE